MLHVITNKQWEKYISPLSCALCPEGRKFESHFSHQVATLGKPSLVVAYCSLACLLRHSINAVVGSAPMSSSRLQGAAPGSGGSWEWQLLGVAAEDKMLICDAGAQNPLFVAS